MHTLNELDLWNHRRAELAREAGSARRPKMESSAVHAERGATMRWRLWIRGHRTA